ncbi:MULTISPECIES: hypothetical protein [unclassified Synechocystis]|uniref:hypothetical protein n=1 Tax=unclassified Synechocystis TaxID=2640012 RepID=UPI00040C6A3B|nr:MULTISPECIES: hypothetical protein [unclassified Synechocystis]MCT0252502.1 hypothetical protein [Synechocystis sp. CS-94]
MYEWSKRVERMCGERQGKRGAKENLVVGRRKNRKELIVAMLFIENLNAAGFEGGLELCLMPALTIT